MKNFNKKALNSYYSNVDKNRKNNKRFVPKTEPYKRDIFLKDDIIDDEEN